MTSFQHNINWTKKKIDTQANPLAQVNTLRVARILTLTPHIVYQRHYDHNWKSDLQKQNPTDKILISKVTYNILF